MTTLADQQETTRGPGGSGSTSIDAVDVTRKRRTLPLVLLLAGVVLVVVGLCGVDAWVYDLTTRYTNTPDPLDRDFYHLTRSLWNACRLMGLIWGAAAAYFAILVLRPDGWHSANRAAVAGLIASGLCHLLKMLIGRVRPNHALSHLDFRPFLSHFTDHVPTSFPSGEVATAFAIATILTLTWRRGGLVFYSLATLTAAARVISGAHYVSDVAAAAILATLISTWTYRRVEALAGALPRAPWLGGTASS